MTDRPAANAALPAAYRRRLVVAGRPAGRWARDIALIVIGIVSVIFEPLSIAIHAIAGLAFVAMIGPHLWDRRRWISGTLAGIRRGRGLPARRRWSLAQALLLLAVAVVVTVSGLWDWLGVPTTIRYHAISGVLLIAGAAWHGWTRRRALLRWRPIRAARASGGWRSDANRDPGRAAERADAAGDGQRALRRGRHRGVPGRGRPGSWH